MSYPTISVPLVLVVLISRYQVQSAIPLTPNHCCTWPPLWVSSGIWTHTMWPQDLQCRCTKTCMCPTDDNSFDEFSIEPSDAPLINPMLTALRVLFPQPSSLSITTRMPTVTRTRIYSIPASTEGIKMRPIKHCLNSSSHALRT